MSTEILDINNSVEAKMQAILGVQYKILQYKEEVSQNSFTGSMKRFASRATETSEIETVTKFVTFNQGYELIIVDSYYESNIDDSGKSSTMYDMKGKILDIFKELVNSRAGLPSVVLNVESLSMSEPEYLTNQKVIVQRAIIDIKFRINLL